MGTEQYAAHDWSYVTLSLMLLSMVLVVFSAMGLFLYMVHRAGQVTGPRRERPQLPDSVRDEAEPLPAQERRAA